MIKFVPPQRLGKNPEDFPDAKSQPHVQVALRLKAKGQSPRSGDVMQYIFCLGENDESSRSAQADRAYHPDEIRRSDGRLKIGKPSLSSSFLRDGNLVAVQITTTTCPLKFFPPSIVFVTPLKARTALAWRNAWVRKHIDFGSNSGPLAFVTTGLNPTEYARIMSAPQQDRSLGILDSLVPDTERFRNTTPFSARCHACSTDTPFLRLLEAEVRDLDCMSFQNVHSHLHRPQY